MKLWVREGGEGGARTVLLHGLGANADVWLPLVLSPEMLLLDEP